MTPPPATAAPRSVTFWQLQLLGWGAFWVAMTWSRVGRYPLSYMMASKAAMAVIGLAYTSLLLRPLYRRLLRGDPSLALTIGVAAVASYLVAVLWTATHSLVDIYIERALLSPEAHISNFWQVFGGTLYDAFAVFAWSVLYVGIKHQQALHAERERSLRAEALVHAARLDALRVQLNPHFLFNALNAISTLVVDGRSNEAATMIARLADLLRSTLERPPNDEVPLSAEIDLVRRYLDIEQVRLGERLQVELAVDASAMKCRVPSLLLQPIVENAVRHAIAPREEGGRIVVTATRTDGRLCLSVDDDGPGLLTKPNGNGIGLANTRERLIHRYGALHTFAFEESPLRGLRVRIDLPYRE
ncbi:MAG: histidine kinase [Gemmatimonadaceae bacterium]